MRCRRMGWVCQGCSPLHRPRAEQYAKHDVTIVLLPSRDAKTTAHPPIRAIRRVRLQVTSPEVTCKGPVQETWRQCYADHRAADQERGVPQPVDVLLTDLLPAGRQRRPGTTCQTHGSEGWHRHERMACTRVACGCADGPEPCKRSHGCALSGVQGDFIKAAHPALHLYGCGRSNVGRKCLLFSLKVRSFEIGSKALGLGPRGPGLSKSAQPIPHAGV